MKTGENTFVFSEEERAAKGNLMEQNKMNIPCLNIVTGATELMYPVDAAENCSGPTSQYINMTNGAPSDEEIQQKFIDLQVGREQMAKQQAVSEIDQEDRDNLIEATKAKAVEDYKAELKAERAAKRAAKKKPGPKPKPKV